MSHPYDNLSPDLILNAIESVGYMPDGSMLALNSYENRVLQIGIDEGLPLVAKFYRPGRWSDAAILEDHAFSLALAAEEIPVVPPIVGADDKTLFEFEGFRFALYRRQGGRWPDLENPEKLEWIGRFLGRIHQLGAAGKFHYRPVVDVMTLGIEPSQWLLSSNMLPLELESQYKRVTTELIEHIQDDFANTHYQPIRLHGDCHPGNILWTDDGPHFVDMDDCRSGPAIQDLWMLLSGDEQERSLQLGHLLEGYNMFWQLNPAELQLIEPLRTLRLIHYNAWLARRWGDPAFPRAFTWFNTHQYWQGHLQDLQQQAILLQQPALRPAF